jgi:predicted nuclease of restriction endonuclease-like (RecB) superfamily
MPPKQRQPAKPKADESRLSRGSTRDGAIFPVAPLAAALPADYAATLQEIKTYLRQARIRAVLAANPVVIESYWHTGKTILARQKKAAWGAKVIDRLSADLKEAFPDMSGLSSRNLLAMKVFAREFPDGPIAQQAVAQLPWGHILQIIQRSKESAVRDFYIRETLTHGWGRDILELQIKNRLHLRAGKAQNNFALTMPPAESDMAAQLFKDPYLFDFVGTADPPVRSRWNRRSSITFKNSSLNSAPALRSWADKCGWKWVARTTHSTCSFTTCVSAAMSSLNSRLESLSQAMSARSTSTAPPSMTSCAIRMTKAPSAFCSAKAKIVSLSSMPSRGWIKPSPSLPGRRS